MFSNEEGWGRQVGDIFINIYYIERDKERGRRREGNEF